MKRIALSTLAILSPLILLSFLVGGRVGELLFASSAVMFPAAVCALGARGVAARRIVALLALVLAVSALGLLLTSPGAGSTGGLPAATWWMLLGFGLAPLLLVTLGYAGTFRPPPRRSGAPARPVPPAIGD
jgi:hypothetical protein